MTSTPLLRGEGLRKHYTTTDGVLDRLLGTGETVRAVDGVDLALESGETLGVVGESGCGKSTLGRLLVGLEEPTAGRVRYRGTDLASHSRTDRRAFRTSVQYLFQNPGASLNPQLPVGDLVAEPLAVHDIVPADRRGDRVGELLERVGLSPAHADRFPHEFSGGQRQRIAIARVLAVEPEVLICDEPVSALDASERARVLNLLADLQEAFDLSYLFVSHDLSVVEHVADRIAVMYLGRIVESGTPGDLFDGEVHPYTEALLSAIPEPDPLWGGDRIVLPGDVPSPIDPPAGCRFHTRCHRVVPPDRFDLGDTEVRAVMDLRTHLKEVSDDPGRYPGDSLDPATLRAAAGIPTALTDPDAESTLECALEAAASGRLDRARSLLADAFESPCETDCPTLRPVDDGHAVACHRFAGAREGTERDARRPDP